MSIDFEIGDEVVMINCDHVYGLTKSGSIGKVIQVYEESLVISFSILTGVKEEFSSSRPRNFTVLKHYAQLLDSNSPRKTKIERKIYLMWERQPYVQKIKVDKIQKERKQHA